MTQPASVPADGNLKVLFVATIADPENPTVAECTAGSVADLSCYLTATGFNPSTDEQTITDDRLCSRATFERPGRHTDSLEVTYVFNPASPGDDVAYQTLAYLEQGFLVLRWGVPYETAIAAADTVDVYPIQCGIQKKQPPTANSVLMATQKLFIPSPGVQRDVTVAA
jgi:hypothetical protein